MPPILPVDDGDDILSNVTDEDAELVRTVLYDIKILYTIYPVILITLGLPGNFLTIYVLRANKVLQKNFVSTFLLYLSFYNILNLVIGLSSFWMMGAFDIDLHTVSYLLMRIQALLIMIFHMILNWTLTALSVCKLLYIIYPISANYWCSKSLIHAIMFCILIVSIAFQFSITDGGKMVTEERNVHLAERTGDNYILFSKTRAIMQAFFFFYSPCGIILIVNALIIIVYSRTRRDSDKSSQLVVRHLLIAHRCAIITLLCDIQLIVMEIPYTYYFTEREQFYSKGTREAARGYLFYAVSVMLLYTNYSVNFIVYCFFGHHYRHQLQKLFLPILSRIFHPESLWLTETPPSTESETVTTETIETGGLRAAGSLKNLFHDYGDSRFSIRLSDGHRPYGLYRERSYQLSSIDDSNQWIDQRTSTVTGMYITHVPARDSDFRNLARSISAQIVDHYV